VASFASWLVSLADRRATTSPVTIAVLATRAITMTVSFQGFIMAAAWCKSHPNRACPRAVFSARRVRTMIPMRLDTHGRSRHAAT